MTGKEINMTSPARTVCPFTIAVDTREQLPFEFENILAAGKLVLVSTQQATLASGDYSIVGHEEAVAVERKTLADLYGTLTAGRDRFERELERLASYEFSAVVVEADWHQIVDGPLFVMRAKPASIVGTIHAWQQRFPKTHWLPAGSRPLAEQATYGVLRRYWIDRVEGRRSSVLAVAAFEYPMEARGPHERNTASAILSRENGST
jgi:DNA excision repair protein ERCC-4